jgi:hypothetical protein
MGFCVQTQKTKECRGPMIDEKLAADKRSFTWLGE